MGLNSFQAIFLVIDAICLTAVILAAFRRWFRRRETLFASGLCLLAAVAVGFPNSTTRLAHAVGINRGADLVSYCATLVMMAGFWMTYMRLRVLRREVTSLVRHIAILEVHDNSGTATDVAGVANNA